MKIPDSYLNQHFDELIAMALSLLRKSGLHNLVDGDITDELLHNARNLVNKTLFRLLKASTPPPTSEVALTALLYIALSKDAMSVRRTLVRARSKTVRIDVRPQSAHSDDVTVRIDTFDCVPPNDFAGEEIHSQVVVEADAVICRLMKDGFITAGEGAEDFRLIVRNYLCKPDQKFSKHLFDVVCSRNNPLNAKTANRWWNRVRSILASEFAPVLRPARGVKIK
jgi:hypothetical protein